MTSPTLQSFFEPQPVDLDTCAREPIHVPGAIQPHGVLLVLDEAGRVVQASANTAAVLGRSVEDALGSPLADLIGDGGAEVLGALDAAASGVQTALCPLPDGAGAAACYAAVHTRPACRVVELEPVGGTPVEAAHLMSEVEGAMQRLHAAESMQAWCDVAASEVRRLSGFDRVMVYRFDADWHGEVVAEDKDEAMESFLGLHFPAGDIPRQARHLYVINTLRYIADTGYQPAPLVPEANPVTGQPLDLSLSLLRSVSPIHIEYLHHMGVGASMSISIVQGGALWGLIACHHPRPLLLPQPIRAGCGLLGQVLSLQLPLLQEAERARGEAERQKTHARLLEHLTHHATLAEGLTAADPGLLDLVPAHGAVVLHGGTCSRVGDTPPEDTIRRIAAQVHDLIEGDVFATQRLATLCPEPEVEAAQACGVLAIPLGTMGDDWVLWFRDEQLRHVHWAGQHAEPHSAEARISPRRSFEKWTEVVRGTSEPWSQADIDAAERLRRAILEVVLRQAEKLARLNKQLATTNRSLQISNRELQEFASVVAHDLKEPLRKISMFANLIDIDLREKVSEEGQYYLSRMQHAAVRLMGVVSDVLALSQVTSGIVRFAPVPLLPVVRHVLETLQPDIQRLGASIEAGDMPTVVGDRVLITQLMHHLVNNALKFRHPQRRPEVTIRAEILHTRSQRPECCIVVEDNGLGFEEQYAKRIFEPFERLHQTDQFEGSGVGLAICRRIVDRHHGAIEATSTPGAGSTFTVCLPIGHR